MDMDGNGKVNTFLCSKLQYRITTAQVVFGGYLRDSLPIIGVKNEPKQEEELVREYRDLTSAR